MITPMQPKPRTGPVVIHDVTRPSSFRSVCLVCITCAIVGSPMLVGCAPRKPSTTTTEPGGAGAKPTDELKAIDLYAEGALAYRRGDTARALQALSAAVKENPQLRMARVMLADIYRENGDYQNAATHYEAAANLDPYTLANHYNLGVMLQYLRRFKDAAAAYLRALDLDPRDLKSNMNLGTVYVALGQLDDATNYLERATMIDPKSADAWSNLGVAYDAKGKYQAAEQAYRKALELNPSPTTLLNLGTNLTAQGRGGEAVAMLKEAVSRSNTSAAHKRLGDAYALAKQYDDALKEYDGALAIDRNYYFAMNEKANVLMKQYHIGLEMDDDKLKQAVALWKVSLRLNPQQPKVEEAIKQSENKALFGT